MFVSHVEKATIRHDYILLKPIQQISLHSQCNHMGASGYVSPTKLNGIHSQINIVS